MFNMALFAKQASTRPGHRFETPTQRCARRSPPKRVPPCVRPRHARSPVALVALSDRARARCRKRPSRPALSNGAQARCCKRARALGRGMHTSCVRIPAGCVWMLWTFLGSAQRLMKIAERLRLCDDWTLNSMTVSGSATTMSFL